MKNFLSLILLFYLSYLHLFAETSYAPSSIAGRTITFIGNGSTETASFSADGNVTDGEDWTYYEYSKISDNVGVITYTFANETNPAPEVETLTFTSSSGGTYDWIEYSDSTKSNPIDQGSGQFTFEPFGYAPSSLTGLSFSIDDVQNNPTIDFPEVEKYFSDQFIYGYENSQWQEYPYVYNKLSGFDAELTILYEDGNKTYYLTFSDDQNASGNWSKNSTDENTSGSTQFTIITDDLAPETLSTWYYETDPLSDWIYFNSSESANFFYDYFPETNSSFVENITYKWEKLGPSIGRITMDTDEETWLFFSNLTYGYYDLSSKDGSFESSGIFQLSKFDDGLSVDDLSGDKITIGEKHYIFHEGNEVSTLNQDGSSTLTTYAYIRTDQNEAILSVADGLLIDMKFLDYDYGRITNGGSGYFEYYSSYATKGWLWYDDWPWIFSSNQGDWIFQNVFTNDSNETELMYQFKTSGIITKSGELDYIGESNLSKMDAFYWDDYDDFSGTELNSSKWEVGYWGGGQIVTINDGKAQLSGETYSSSAPSLMPSDLLAAAQDSTEGNTFLFFKDEDIYGIQADISIPSQINDYEVGVYLASLDSNPFGSLGAELRYNDNGTVLLFDYLDSGNELKHEENASLDISYQLQITKLDGKTSYYLDGNLIKQFDSSSHEEDYWLIGAFSDNGNTYTTYADNVRVLRKKYYPKGWMWMDYYPWAYSAETGNWLYFKLTKDVDGLPGMIFWDESTNAWELYQP